MRNAKKPALLVVALLAVPLVTATAREAQGPTTLSTVPDWTAEVNQANALFGNRVTSAGDVNGDGYDDALVNARLYDGPDVDEGKSFLYLGSAAGLELSSAWTVEGDQANAQLNSATSAGDVNGDGFGDVIVGIPSYDNDEVDEGRALLFLGSAAGLPTTPAWVTEGNQAGAFYGITVGRAGDVNGDGFDDVLVGATAFDNGEMDEGRAFLFIGSASGLSTTPAWITEGNQVSAQYSRVVGVGDINGDGFDDVGVGAQFYDNGETNEGLIFLFKGCSKGLKTKAFRTLEINEANALFGGQFAGAGDLNGDGFGDLIANVAGSGVAQRVFVYMGAPSGMGPVADLVLQTDQTNANFGISLNTAGDVNGDGFDDIIVGARLYDVTLTNQGRAFVYAGSAAGLISTPLQTFDGEQASEEFGVGVNTAGDVNADGFSDIIVGAHAFDNPEGNEGRALVFHGGP